ncbi:substrate-binding periplasmic protein [Thalassotalea sp. PLHSN55]|uniref:substrate-binding periplasmic protein n=1 Tax=Thalassotalea sp. PLHSN55 TaxID=3435888 RepID=UPI003F85593B
MANHVWLKWITIVAVFVLSLSVKANPVQVVSTERKLLQYQVNGQLKGPSAQIYKMLMKQSQLSIPVDFMPWARAFQKAQTTPNTLIFSLIRTDEREQQFHWLLPVSQLFQTFVGKKSRYSKAQYSLPFIRERVTAVVRNTYGHQLLIKEGFLETRNLYVASSMEVATKLFFEDKVDFVFTEPNVIRAEMGKYQMTKGDLVAAPLLEKAIRKSYIAINKNSDSTLTSLLMRAASEVKNTAEYKRLFAHIDL